MASEQSSQVLNHSSRLALLGDASSHTFCHPPVMINLNTLAPQASRLIGRLCFVLARALVSGRLSMDLPEGLVGIGLS